MRAVVICAIRSPTFSSSARARSGLTMSQWSPLFSNSISPESVFKAMRRTCAVVASVNFLSRNSSAFLSMSFLTDCLVRNVSLELSKRTYILPSNAASFPNRISGGLSEPINLSLSFGRFRPPFVVAAPYFYFFIAILNDDAVDLASIEIDHVLRLPPGLLRVRLFHLKEPEVGKHSKHNDTKD